MTVWIVPSCTVTVIGLVSDTPVALSAGLTVTWTGAGASLFATDSVSTVEPVPVESLLGEEEEEQPAAPAAVAAAATPRVPMMTLRR
ncbi:hypothetical protein L3i22_037570 [Actinoplanes sp. L3-i22]|nr:hypothetical protein L3i22_037570 [Actinoplanes sp. L3-i22]